MEMKIFRPYIGLKNYKLRFTDLFGFLLFLIEY